MADHEGDSDGVSVVPVETPQEPFTYKGACTDEVTLKFDDGEELFVSENLLRYASPVFADMLKENQDGVFELKERSYADMLVFLRIFHPGLEDKVTESNVFAVVELAEAFSVKRLIMMCKECLVDMTKRATEKLQDTTYSGASSELSRTTALTAFFTILTTATRYHYDDIEETALSAIARVSCNAYMGEMIEAEKCGIITGFFYQKNWGMTTMVGHIVSERNKCRQFYQKLPGSTQMKLTHKRLMNIENNQFL